jgi:hypothetical protein
MAYAEWFVPTTASTTSVTINGVAGYWKEMPKEFPPIAMLDYYGSTTPTFPEFSIAYMTVLSTTAFSGGAPVAMRIESFIKNTRWVRLDQQYPGAWSIDNAAYKLMLKYRSVNEMGQGDVAN